ncbi:hypothetical protein [Pseudoxanthomonas sp. J35]|uniref:hypothetical protein n=1 Tax=Pseudoxanthomonas sp. J35 TaxID=935852 RepID=UPI0004B5FE69|nr:hypothetical protein [Pseudoxanthomonas sp. J35]
MEADRRLQRDIVFEDKVYEAASTVHARYDLDSIEAYYVWWAFSEDTWALGPRAGLTWYRIDFGLKATLEMDGTPASGELEEHYRGDLPAPALRRAGRLQPVPDRRQYATPRFHRPPAHAQQRLAPGAGIPPLRPRPSVSAETVEAIRAACYDWAVCRRAIRVARGPTLLPPASRVQPCPSSRTSNWSPATRSSA